MPCTSVSRIACHSGMYGLVLCLPGKSSTAVLIQQKTSLDPGTRAGDGNGGLFPRVDSLGNQAP